VRAGRVVLAAGAYNSPTTLMRSGIGAAADLAALNIDCRVDLGGVGANLMDHPVTLVTLQADYPTDPMDMRMAAMLKLRSTPDLHVDDLKISFYPGDLFNMSGLCGMYLEVNVSDARGSVRLASSDPAAAPLIDHRFLSDPRDLERMVAGMKHAIAIQRVMDQSQPCELLLPDPTTAADDELLREHALAFHSTGYHPSGTCRMGAPDDAHAVVDPRLRVRGVEGLYIADASVMPEIPRCNLNLPTMMIGEHASDLIREDLAG
jgi:choline dehydrogenase